VRDEEIGITELTTHRDCNQAARWVNANRSTRFADLSRLLNRQCFTIPGSLRGTQEEPKVPRFTAWRIWHNGFDWPVCPFLPWCIGPRELRGSLFLSILPDWAPSGL